MLALALQSWKEIVIPRWRRRVLRHIQIHGALSRMESNLVMDKHLSAWASVVNAKRFKRHRIVRTGFRGFTGLVEKQKVARGKAEAFFG